MEIYFVVGCGKTIYFPLLLALSITYKMILHAVGLVLAFLTRNIKVDILNDYHYNTAIIITSSLLLIAVSVTLPPLFDYVNWYDAVWDILVFLGISVYLGFTFVPKVGLYAAYSAEHVRIVYNSHSVSILLWKEQALCPVGVQFLV